MSGLLIVAAGLTAGGVLAICYRVLSWHPAAALLALRRGQAIALPRWLKRLTAAHPSRPAGLLPRSVSVSQLNKAQAEELLDWLEATGHRNCQLHYQAGQGFTVEYKA
jgi:hypothetical protein